MRMLRVVNTVVIFLSVVLRLVRIIRPFTSGSIPIVNQHQQSTITILAKQHYLRDLSMVTMLRSC
jgi:hypothetical protein